MVAAIPMHPGRSFPEKRYGKVQQRTMRVLEYLVDMFIQSFGITRPGEAQRRRVTLLLGGALLTAALLVIAIGVGMVLYLHISR
jgi:hypothetical protein